MAAQNCRIGSLVIANPSQAEVTMSATFSSIYACDDNTITITVRSDIDIELCDGTCGMVTVSGLSGVSVDDPATDLTSTSSIVDSGTAPTFSSGTLTFKLAIKLIKDTDYQIELASKNAESVQVAPALNIQFSCVSSVLSSSPTGVGIVGPLLAATTCAGHTTNSPGAENTVTVRLTLAGPIKTACLPSITLSGLSGVQICGAGAQSSILGGTDAGKFDVTANGDDAALAVSAELITLTPKEDLAAGDLEFTMTVRNPCYKQSGSDILAKLAYGQTPGGQVKNPPAESAVVTLNTCADLGPASASDKKPAKTHAPAFTSLTLASTSALEGANIITLGFTANFDFREGMAFKLEGLTDITEPVSGDSTFAAEVDSAKGVLTLTALQDISAGTATPFAASVTNMPLGSGPATVVLSVTGYMCGCAGTVEGDAVSTVGPYKPTTDSFDFMEYSEVRKYDTDGDFSWSASEFAAWAAASGNAGSFADIDVDGDGVLSSAEYAAAISAGTITALAFPWGSSNYSHCFLHHTMLQLRDMTKSGTGPQYRTGGLGKLMVVEVFESWICVAGHACSWPKDQVSAIPSSLTPTTFW